MAACSLYTPSFTTPRSSLSSFHGSISGSICGPRRQSLKSCSSLSFAASEGLLPPASALPVLKSRSRVSRRVAHGYQTCKAALGEYTVSAAVVYGAALFGGGLFAYLRTGSKGSLSGGLTGGALLGITYFLLQNPNSESLGEALGFGSSLLFAALFGIRLFATKKPVPAGPLLVLSSVASIVFASAYFS